MKESAASYTLLIAALGMMASLMAVEIRDLESWAEATSPGFVAGLLAHLGTVIGAYIGGRLMPGGRST